MKCARDLNTTQRGLGSTLNKIYVIQKKYIAIFKDMEEEFISKHIIDKFLIRKISQYDLDGNYIKTFNNRSEITDSKNNLSKIFKCCNGKQKSAMGYIWKWES